MWLLGYIYFRVIIKSTTNGKWKKEGQGKLFSKYFNLRKGLKKVGLLSEERDDEGLYKSKQNKNNCIKILKKYVTN